MESTKDINNIEQEIADIDLGAFPVGTPSPNNSEDIQKLDTTLVRSVQIKSNYPPIDGSGMSSMESSAVLVASSDPNTSTTGIGFNDVKSDTDSAGFMNPPDLTDGVAAGNSRNPSGSIVVDSLDQDNTANKPDKHPKSLTDSAITMSTPFLQHTGNKPDNNPKLLTDSAIMMNTPDLEDTATAAGRYQEEAVVDSEMSTSDLESNDAGAGKHQIPVDESTGQMNISSPDNTPNDDTGRILTDFTDGAYSRAAASAKPLCK
jgi:hypothetical protein